MDNFASTFVAAIGKGPINSDHWRFEEFMAKTIAVVIKPGTPLAVEALARLVKAAPGNRLIMEAEGHHAVQNLPV